MRATTAAPGAMFAILGALIFCGACAHNSTTEPSSTSTSTSATAAAPTVSESFSGVLPVGGFKLYTFNIAVNGTVNLTLNSVSGANVPSTVQLGLGIGQPSGIDCSTTVQEVEGTTAAAPQVTGTFGPGLFCARVYDVGNLIAPATFNITVAHP